MEKKRQTPLNGAMEGHGGKVIGELLTGGGIRALLWRALPPMWGRHLVACHPSYSLSRARAEQGTMMSVSKTTIVQGTAKSAVIH